MGWQLQNGSFCLKWFEGEVSPKAIDVVIEDGESFTAEGKKSALMRTTRNVCYFGLDYSNQLQMGSSL